MLAILAMKTCLQHNSVGFSRGGVLSFQKHKIVVLVVRTGWLPVATPLCAAGGAAEHVWCDLADAAAHIVCHTSTFRCKYQAALKPTSDHCHMPAAAPHQAGAE